LSLYYSISLLMSLCLSPNQPFHTLAVPTSCPFLDMPHLQRFSFFPVTSLLEVLSATTSVCFFFTFSLLPSVPYSNRPFLRFSPLLVPVPSSVVVDQTLYQAVPPTNFFLQLVSLVGRLLLQPVSHLSYSRLAHSPVCPIFT
jgi:hypothetical protein